MSRLPASLLLLLAALLCGCGGTGKSDRTASGTASVERPVRGKLVSGELQLPAARAFGEPGFHQVLRASARLPSALPPARHGRVVLELRDAGRRSETCSSEHPLSGCPTVDWSDDPSRPKVPRSGVFENAIVFQLASGKRRTLYLRQSGKLGGKPDPFKPG